MDGQETSGRGVERVRRWLLWALLIGLMGTEVELLLLAHYEDVTQWAPLVLIAAAIGGVAWHGARKDRTSLRALQALMILFVAAGLTGIGLHYRGAAAFQREINPAIGTWELIQRVARAQAPPLLAPGVMVQLGLIGLAYGFTDSGEKKRRECHEQAATHGGRGS
jgi:hypothetical protein